MAPSGGGGGERVKRFGRGPSVRRQCGVSVARRGPPARHPAGVTPPRRRHEEERRASENIYRPPRTPRSLAGVPRARAREVARGDR